MNSENAARRYWAGLIIHRLKMAELVRLVVFCGYQDLKISGDCKTGKGVSPTLFPPYNLMTVPGGGRC